MKHKLKPLLLDNSVPPKSERVDSVLIIRIRRNGIVDLKYFSQPIMTSPLVSGLYSFNHRHLSNQYKVCSNISHGKSRCHTMTNRANIFVVLLWEVIRIICSVHDFATVMILCRAVYHNLIMWWRSNERQREILSLYATPTHWFRPACSEN